MGAVAEAEQRRTRPLEAARAAARDGFARDIGLSLAASTVGIGRYPRSMSEMALDWTPQGRLIQAFGYGDEARQELDRGMLGQLDRASAEQAERLRAARSAPYNEALQREGLGGFSARVMDAGVGSIPHLALSGSLGALLRSGTAVSALEGAMAGAETNANIYDALVSRGYAPEEARRAASGPSVLAGALTGGIGASFGGFTDDFLRGALRGRGRAAAAGRGFLSEGLEEAVQSGQEQFLTNAGIWGVDHSQNLFEGVPEAVLIGGAVGGIAGGGLGAIFGGRPNYMASGSAAAALNEQGESEAANITAGADAYLRRQIDLQNELINARAGVLQEDDLLVNSRPAITDRSGEQQLRGSDFVPIDPATQSRMDEAAWNERVAPTINQMMEGNYDALAADHAAGAGPAPTPLSEPYSPVQVDPELEAIDPLAARIMAPHQETRERAALAPDPITREQGDAIVDMARSGPITPTSLRDLGIKQAEPVLNMMERRGFLRKVGDIPKAKGTEPVYETTAIRPEDVPGPGEEVSYYTKPVSAKDVRAEGAPEGGSLKLQGAMANANSIRGRLIALRAPGPDASQAEIDAHAQRQMTLENQLISAQEEIAKAQTGRHGWSVIKRITNPSGATRDAPVMTFPNRTGAAEYMARLQAGTGQQEATAQQEEVAPMSAARKRLNAAEAAVQKERAKSEWHQNLVKDRAQSRLKEMGFSEEDISVEVSPIITHRDPATGNISYAHGYAEESKTSPGKVVIRLAANAYNPDLTIDEMVERAIDTLNHETLHATEIMAKITRAERAAWDRATRETFFYDTNGTKQKFTWLQWAYDNYSKTYVDPEGRPDMKAIREEARAEMLKSWVRTGKGVKAETKGIFNKIKAFFRSLFNSVTAETVMERIDSGEVASRYSMRPESRRSRLFSAVNRREFLGSVAAGVIATPTMASAQRAQSQHETFLSALNRGAASGIEWVRNNHPNEDMKLLARTLLDGGLGQVELTVRGIDRNLPPGVDLLYGNRGVTDFRDGRVRITLNLDEGGATPLVLMHEAVHAYINNRYSGISRYLDHNRQLVGDTGVRAADEAIEEFRGLWEDFTHVIEAYHQTLFDDPEADPELPIWLTEAYRTPDELLVRSLTDPDLQEWMNSRGIDGEEVKVGEPSLWDRFMDWISGLFGATSERARTMLDHVVDASYSVLNRAALDDPDGAYSMAIQEYMERDFMRGPPPPSRRYSAAGIRAVGAPLLNLQHAVDMEIAGDTRGKIYYHTGWYRGTDGDWRYEISDKDSRVDLQAMGQLQGNLARRIKDINDQHAGGLITAHDLQDKLKDARGFLSLHLIMKHPDLFAAYPFLRNTRVAVYKDEDNEGGYASLYTNTIHMGTNGKPYELDDARSLLLHEIQHLIQEHEGFVNGANYKYVSNLIANSTNPKVLGGVADIRGRIKKAAKKDYAYFVDYLHRKDNQSWFTENLYRWLRRESLVQDLDPILTPTPQIKALQKVRERSAETSLDAAINWMAYAATAGEVEARNTQRRRNMDANELRREAPWRTYDVPENEINDIFNVNKVTSYSTGGFNLPMQSIEPRRYSLVGYHGTAENGFQEFDDSKIGSGVGAQRFGFGHYFTSMKAVAEYWRDVAARRRTPTISGKSVDDFIDSIPTLEKDKDKAAMMYQWALYVRSGRSAYDPYLEARDELDSLIRRNALAPSAQLERAIESARTEAEFFRSIPSRYRVSLPKGSVVEASLPGKDTLLDLEGAVSKEIQEKLLSVGVIIPPRSKGRVAYEAAINKYKTPSLTAEVLRGAGINGLAYVNTGDPEAYVIFSGKDVSINRRFSLAQSRIRSRILQAVREAPFAEGTASKWRSYLSKIDGVTKEEMEWSGIEDMLAAAGDQEKIHNWAMRSVLLTWEEMIWSYQMGPAAATPEDVYESGQDIEEMRSEDPDLYNNLYGDISYDDAIEKRLSRKFRNPKYDRPDSGWVLPRTSNDRYGEMLIRFAHPYGATFKNDNHFDGEQNILGWARYTLRQFGDGLTMMIEEIQSDWHQTGKKDGYLKKGEQPDIAAKNKLLEKNAAERSRLMEERNDILKNFLTIYGQNKNGINAQVLSTLHYLDPGRLNRSYERALGILSMDYSSVYHSDAINSADFLARAVHSSMYYSVGEGPTYKPDHQKLISNIGEDLYKDLERNLSIYHDNDNRLYENHIEMETIVLKEPIADAPFKGTDWAKLVFKNLMLHAIDVGATRIEWTSGEIQDARWQGHAGGTTKFYDEVLPAVIQKVLKEHGGVTIDKKYRQFVDDGGMGEERVVPGFNLTHNLVESIERKGFRLFSAPRQDRASAQAGVNPGGKVDDLFGRRVAMRYTAVSDAMANSFARRIVGSSPEEAKKRLDAFTAEIADRQVGARRMITETLREGATISDSSDFVMFMDLFPRATEHKIDQFRQNLARPAVLATNRVNATKRELEDLAKVSELAKLEIEVGTDPSKAITEIYLYAMHSKERNAFVRDVRQRQDIDTSAIILDGSGMTDEEADVILDWMSRYKKRPAVLDAAKAWWKITHDTRAQRIMSGLTPDFDLIQDDTIPRFQHYVPLRGKHLGIMDEEWSEAEFGQGTGKGFYTRGREDPRMKGRTGDYAGNIMENIILQHIGTLIRSEKVKVGQALHEFVEANKKESEPYLERVYVMPKKSVVDSKKRTRYRSLTPKELEDASYYHTKVGGKDIIYKVKDALLLEALSAPVEMSPDNVRNAIYAVSGVVKTFGKLATAWNPDFWSINWPRDIWTAVVQTAEHEKDIKLEVTKNAIAIGLKGFGAAAAGTTDPDLQRRLDRLSELGGLTGAYGLHTLGDEIVKLRDSMEELSIETRDKKKINRAFKAGINYLENLNDAMENATRLAVFEALTKRGVSDLRAAQAAKEATINFNKKGKLANSWGQLYLFFNARMQGLSRFSTAGLSKAGGKIILGFMAVGLLQDILNNLLGPDDEYGNSLYDKVPDYILQSRMVIMMPDGSYVALPMPQGWSIFHSIGRNIGRVVTGRASPMDATMDLFGSLVSLTNPFGAGMENFLVGFAPSVLATPVEIMRNRDFTGNPIRPQGFPGQLGPASEEHFPDASFASRTVADLLSHATGGGAGVSGLIEIHPDDIDHLFAGFSLGTGKFVSRLANLAGYAMPGDQSAERELTVRDIPVARSFVGSVSGMSVRSEYDEAMRQYLEMGSTMREAERLGDFQTYQENIRRYPRRVHIARLIAPYEREIISLRRMRTQTRQSPNLGDEERAQRMRAINEMEQDLMNRALAVVRREERIEIPERE
jgi:hypothetical protein